MPQLPLLATPIGRAVAPLAEVEASDPPDAAAALADLVDLHGGVVLAEALTGLPEVTAAAADVDVPALRGRLREGLTHLSDQLDDAFEHAFRPRYRLPTPERALEALEHAGAIEQRRGKPAKAVARTLWAPYGEFLETRLKRARFALRDLRTDVAPVLRALGDDAARLERLDAAFGEATHRPVEQLLRRAMPACEAAFARQLQGHLRALPDAPRVDDVRPWFAADGWIPAWFSGCQSLVYALVERERRQLEALVEAALRL